MEGMRTLSVLTLLVALPLGAQTRPDTSALTARLGVDTISVERIIRTATTLEAELLTRS
ncbi:MAG: hypothetical protein RI891_1487, partial [Gemmatimonadota bacterium]